MSTCVCGRQNTAVGAHGCGTCDTCTLNVRQCKWLQEQWRRSPSPTGSAAVHTPGTVTAPPARFSGRSCFMMHVPCGDASSAGTPSASPPRTRCTRTSAWAPSGPRCSCPPAPSRWRCWGSSCSSRTPHTRRAGARRDAVCNMPAAAQSLVGHCPIWCDALHVVVQQH